MRARVLELARGGLAALEANRQRIDDLNVYPVPDGDTGTNMTLTVRAIVEEIERSKTEDRAALASEITRAALMGARGNSGVILSQAVRGAAEMLRDSDDIAGALRGAADAAYRAIKKPVEGTMLTALRELAEEAERGGDLAAIVARGDDCVARTTEMLAQLKQAGVVDAGAAGLVELVRGIAGVLTGEPLPEAPVQASAVNLTDEIFHHELSRYRYCTVFVVEGDGLDADAIEAELEPIGDSLLVVGDRTALKVHVHTDDPGRALSLVGARGTIGGVEIANMHEQTQEREERLLRAVPNVLPSLCEAVAVTSGSGNARLFESLGARVVDGGGTMNPSTAELIAAFDAASALEVVVLPNDRNVLLAAEQAAANASKPVHIVQSLSMQAGLAAMVAFDPELTADENVVAMTLAVETVSTGAVTVASRDVQSNGVAIRKGAWLGLADGEPVAGGDSFDEVTRVVLDKLLAQPRGVLTLLTGEDRPELAALLSELEASHPELELDVHDGGQPHYALLLSAE
ncbi:MAG TPA: DAK2 domain-containing protein [Gaiellaceae bacterium]|nr:DAK2 domain-containing protein [Gaiellaceae bacterium]